MPTENKAITLYAPSEMVEFITKYCQAYQVTRKTGKKEQPAWGTAVFEMINILRQFPPEELRELKPPAPKVDKRIHDLELKIASIEEVLKEQGKPLVA